MDSRRFDRLSSAFTKSFSRRDSLKLSTLGMGAALGGIALHHPAVAQDATPAADADHLGLPEGERTYTMFVQTASAGTWAEKPGEEGVYTLTLTGLPAQTVYFSDRPDRIVGTQTTTEFLDALGFDGDNPPNAALVTTDDAGASDVLVIELFNAVYTDGDDGATLTYDARILENFHETRLGRVAMEQDDAAIPSSFAGASLFIDDCADGWVRCFKPGKEYVGSATFGCCYSFPKCWECAPSHYCNTLAECADGSCTEETARACSL